VLYRFNESEDTLAGYKVLIDDNFHFMDESERVTYGVFATANEAIAECKAIVDECLEPMLQSGMTATALYEQCPSIPMTHGWPSQPGDMPKNGARSFARRLRRRNGGLRRNGYQHRWG
jgi:hypothetical protein